MARLRTLALIFSFVGALACGGSSDAEGGGEDTSPVTSGAEGGEDATDGGRRLARIGDEWDFGGVADRTCRRGSFCCYGPPDDPGEHGQCMAECPEY